MKTTVEIPDELFRAAESKAAIEGVQLKDLLTEGLQMRIGMKTLSSPVTGTDQPLLENMDVLPLIKSRPGAAKLKITPQRIHALEMEAEFQRNEASLR